MHSKKGLLWRKRLATEPTAITATFSSPESWGSTPLGKQATTLPAGLRSHLVLNIPITANKGVKHLCGKFALLYVGIACISATGVLLVPSHRTIAATLTSGRETAQMPTDPSRNIKSFGNVIGHQSLEVNHQEKQLTTDSGQRTDSSKTLLGEFPKTLIRGVSSIQVQNPRVISPTPSGNSESNPNQERFFPNPPTPAPITPETKPSIQPSPSQPPVQPPPTPAPQAVPNLQTIQVQKIEITGSTVFSPNQFNPIVQPYEGRALTLEQLRQVADKVTQLYLDRGYITSRAILVDQEITNGLVQIRVVEGSIEQIQIEGAKRINPNYVRSRVRLGAGTPLNTAKLEDQLRLLKADPLFENVEASLRAGTRLGQSILIVRVIEANPFEGSVGIDNYSPPSVGSERLGLTALYRNLTGNGDAVAGSYYHTAQGGSDNVELNYRLPVNAMNGAVQLRTAFTWSKIIDPAVKFLDIEGNSQLYEISFQQPLVRTPREEFALSVGFTAQDNQSLSGLFPGALFSPGADPEGYSRTRVIKFGQDYVHRDIRGAWSVRSLFSFGIGILGATINRHPIPDGRFFSWLGQVQRVQILNENNLLIIGSDVQLTPNSLFPSQQFVIGGGQSLRGYRQNIRAGDNGVRFTVEDRLIVQRDESGAPTFQLAPFFDAGYVWNADKNPSNSSLPSQRFLAGLGFGILWQLQPRLDLRFDYAYPLIDLKDRGENAQDNGIYFSVRYRF